MKTFLSLIVLLGLTAVASAAIKFRDHATANSAEFQLGLVGAWPQVEAVVPDDYTLSSNEISSGFSLKTTAEVAAIKATNKAAADAWFTLVTQRDHSRQSVAPELQKRIGDGETEFGQLKLDALQSEFVGLLLHAYLQNTELLLLVTKAVAGTAATNNLTVAERQRVAALRPQLVFPQQPDFTQDDRDRAVAIRDGVLIPHYQLYQAAKDLLSKISTNATPVDPAVSTNWPAVEIGD